MVWNCTAPRIYVNRQVPVQWLVCTSPSWSWSPKQRWRMWLVETPRAIQIWQVFKLSSQKNKIKKVWGLYTRSKSKFYSIKYSLLFQEHIILCSSPSSDMIDCKPNATQSRDKARGETVLRSNSTLVKFKDEMCHSVCSYGGQWGFIFT